MSWSDPIADMLTRVRNGIQSGHTVVEVPHSKLKGELARVMKREGFISDFVVESQVPRTLRIYLRYSAGGDSAIRGLKRESCAGLRRYVTATDVPRVLRGQGVAVLSTSAGMMTDREAREKHVGGEWMCTIW
jgi:small subunit ribosomal protein S8